MTGDVIIHRAHKLDDREGPLTPPTLRVEARFKNARLYNAIVADAIVLPGRSAAGTAASRRGPIASWCRLHQLSYAAVSELLTLKRSPLRAGQHNDDEETTPVWEWRPVCLRLATLLGHEPVYLFPCELYERVWPTLIADVDGSRLLEAHALPTLLPAAQEQQIARDDARSALARALATLSPREAQVLRLRFGLDESEEEHSLRDTATSLDRSPERIRQIEARALRKLRHPSRSRVLRAHFDALMEVKGNGTR